MSDNPLLIYVLGKVHGTGLKSFCELAKIKLTSNSLSRPFQSQLP